MERQVVGDLRQRHGGQLRAHRRQRRLNGRQHRVGAARDGGCEQVEGALQVAEQLRRIHGVAPGDQRHQRIAQVVEDGHLADVKTAQVEVLQNPVQPVQQRPDVERLRKPVENTFQLLDRRWRRGAGRRAAGSSTGGWRSSAEQVRLGRGVDRRHHLQHLAQRRGQPADLTAERSQAARQPAGEAREVRRHGARQRGEGLGVFAADGEAGQGERL